MDSGSARKGIAAMPRPWPGAVAAAKSKGGGTKKRADNVAARLIEAKI